MGLPIIHKRRKLNMNPYTDVVPSIG
jgi:hypothetical protein